MIFILLHSLHRSTNLVEFCKSHPNQSWPTQLLFTRVTLLLPRLSVMLSCTAHALCAKGRWTCCICDIVISVRIAKRNNTRDGSVIFLVPCARNINITVVNMRSQIIFTQSDTVWYSLIQSDTVWYSLTQFSFEGKFL